MTEKSMREAMEEAFDEIDARADKVEEVVDAPEGEPTEQESEQGVSPEEEETPDISGEDAEQADGPDAVEPPEHWSAEEKEQFSALTDPEARRMVLKVRQDWERGYDRKFQDLAEERRQLSEWDKVFEPIDNDLRLAGVSRVQATQRLVAAQQMLQQNPAQGIQWLAQQYGVDLNQRQDEPDVDPQYAGLNSKLQAIEQTLMQQRQAEEQSRVQSVVQQIESFKSQTDANGAPLHPHFDKVRSHMAALANAQPDADLQSLYDQAVYANPETRAAMLAEQERVQKANADKAAREKAAKAKKAATPKSTGGGIEAVKGKSMRETMAMVYDEVTGS